MEEVFRLAKEFFAVVHRSHTASNKKHICVQGAYILADRVRMQKHRQNSTQQSFIQWSEKRKNQLKQK
jgi:hypothetical protein